jgi:acetyl esterase
MRRFLLIALAALAVLAAGGALTAWRWIQTPHGPLDLGPALALNLAPSGGPLDFGPEARRAANARVASLMPERVAGVAVRDGEFPGPAGPVPLRIYTPESDAAPAPLPVIVFIHGGGWWMGDELAIWDGLCSQMAAEVPALVISVDYRLAPEHRFPAAVDDAYAALLWARANARRLGGDPNKIALHGSSAGGNLVGAVTLRARDEGGPAARLQVLVVPAMSLAPPPSESMRIFGQGYGLEGIDAMTDAYLGPDGDPRHPWVSPLLADDVSRLPPALILTAQFDPLRDDAEAYGARLRAAGVEAEVRRFDGTVHGFLLSPDARAEANALSIAALQRAFDDPDWAPPREPLPVRLR